MLQALRYSPMPQALKSSQNTNQQRSGKLEFMEIVTYLEEAKRVAGRYNLVSKFDPDFKTEPGQQAKLIFEQQVRLFREALGVDDPRWPDFLETINRAAGIQF
jgi:hypothetical protein